MSRGGSRLVDKDTRNRKRSGFRGGDGECVDGRRAWVSRRAHLIHLEEWRLESDAPSQALTMGDPKWERAADISRGSARGLVGRQQVEL